MNITNQTLDKIKAGLDAGDPIMKVLKDESLGVTRGQDYKKVRKLLIERFPDDDIPKLINDNRKLRQDPAVMEKMTVEMWDTRIENLNNQLAKAHAERQKLIDAQA